MSNHQIEMIFEDSASLGSKKLLKLDNIEAILNSSEDRITSFLQSCPDPKAWLLVIFHFITEENEAMFKKYTKELMKFVNEEKNLDINRSSFIQILNILTLFYTFLSQKSIEKTEFEEYNLISTHLINTSEQIELTNSLTLIAKGYLLFSKGDYDNSEMTFSNAYDKEVMSRNTNILILCKLGQALNNFVKGNFSEALTNFTMLIEKYDYINDNILECTGITLYNLGKETKAFQIFKKMLEMNGKNYKALCYLSIIEMNKSHLSQDALKQSLDMLSSSFNMLIESGDYSHCNSCHLILLHIINFLILNNRISEAEILRNRLQLVLEEGIFKHCYESNINIKANNVKVDSDKLKSILFTINGKISHYKKQHTEAIGFYKKALQHNSKNLEAHFGLGQLKFNNQDYLSALKNFEECKTTQDSYSLFEINKYIALIKCKNIYNSFVSTDRRTKKQMIEELSTKTEELIILFKQLIEIKPEDIDCLIELAQLLELNNPNEALTIYNQCLDLIYNKKGTSKLYIVEDIYHELLNNIAVIKLNLKKFDDVGELLGKANKLVIDKIADLKKEGSNNQLLYKFQAVELCILFNLGIYYEYNKNYGEAYKIYKSIIKANEYFVDAYGKLSLLSYYRGNIKKSFEYLNKAIEKHYEKQTSEDIRLKDQKEQFNLNSIIKNKLLSCMNKPLNPIILKAIIEWKNISSQEALKTLAGLMSIEGNDPFSLVLIGNINYDIAYHHRVYSSKISEFEMRVQKALEFYYAALDLDPSNAYAAIGIANCLADFNLTGPALDVYKSVGEKLHGCYSRVVNEVLIYINDKKYNKAIYILNTLLVKMRASSHPDYLEVQNIYIKALLENGDFDKGIKLLKTQILKYPDNLVYRYNLAVAFKIKAEYTLSNPNSKVKESDEAKSNLEKAINLLTAINKLRKEKKLIDYQENLLNTINFTYKINDITDICKTLLKDSVKKIEEDKKREARELFILEENSRKYKEILLNRQQMKKEEYEKILEQHRENELKYQSYKETAFEIIKNRNNDLDDKKKKKKKKVEKEEYENENENNDFSYNNEETIKEKHKRKNKKKKLKNNEMDIDDEAENNEYDDFVVEDQEDSFNFDEGESMKEKKKKNKKTKKLRKGDNTDLKLMENDDSFDGFGDD